MDIWTMEQEAEKLRERFVGVNRAAFARETNLKGGQSIIYQHMNALRPISLDAALVYARGFKCNLEDISPRLAREVVSASTRTASPMGNIEDAPALRQFRDVPVVGTVQAGKDGFLEAFDYPVGHGDGSITYPAKDENSYALRVRGDSMRPRIKAGEFIVVEPNHESMPGDDVVVVLLDGQRMVKELLYIRDDEITLGSINNGHGNITVPLEEVDKMHYVAAIIPRGAFYKL